MGRFRIRKKQLIVFGFVFSVVFSDILSNGNLNLLYFFGFFLIIKDFKIRSGFLEDLKIYFAPFCEVIIIEILFSGNTFSPEKILVYSLKILVCISLLSYTKRNFWRVNYRRIIDYLCDAFAILLILAIFTIKYPIFWRLNDSFNSFSKTRLEFLYSEPSVLGILCGLLMIILMHDIFSNRINYRVIREIILLAIIIILTFSMSGIVYTAVSIIALYVAKVLEKKHQVPKKLLIYFVVGISMIVIVLITNNPISQRFFAMFLGMDGSYNFRWSAAVSVFNKTMAITNYWGMGLGNMNTLSGLAFLLNLGIDYKFANSFLYFSTENGFLGIMYIVYLFGLCMKSCIKSTKNNQSLKVGVLVFAFVSQIAGGYFTDPILWIAYGIVCSKEIRNSEIAYRKRSEI